MIRKIFTFIVAITLSSLSLASGEVVSAAAAASYSFHPDRPRITKDLLEMMAVGDTRATNIKKKIDEIDKTYGERKFPDLEEGDLSSETHSFYDYIPAKSREEREKKKLEWVSKAQKEEKEVVLGLRESSAQKSGERVFAETLVKIEIVGKKKGLIIGRPNFQGVFQEGIHDGALKEADWFFLDPISHDETR